MENRESVCKHFAKVSGVGVMVVDREGDVLYQTPQTCGDCAFCAAINTQPEARERCRMTPHYGAHQARRFGGRYIYFCHQGLTHFTSPVMEQGKISYSLSCGPFLMVEPEDYWPNGETGSEALCALLSHIPVLPPERVHALSEMLYYCACFLSQVNASLSFDLIQDQPLPLVITDYITRIQTAGDSGFYPLEKEDELLSAMTRGDVIAAKTLLNDLLGYIFFYSGMRFDVIRSRVLELIVLLSRAAVKGGADAELIFGLNYEYLQEIRNFNNIEDLSYWLSGIMNRFTDYVFHFVDVKHADVIFKAIEYIKTQFMNKITLEDAARVVFLSPTYFSRVFKEETGYTFSGYLNKTRIEKSKKLLRNERINLADIAGMVGYEDQSYFTKVFKKMTGMTPLKFRQSRGQGLQ